MSAGMATAGGGDRSARGHVVAAVVVLGVLVVAGVGIGLLWHVLAPRTEYVFQDGEPLFTEPAPMAPIAADGWFAVLAMAAGVLSGSVTQALLHRRLLGAVIGLAVGSVAGSLIAWRVGHWFGAAEFASAAASAKDGEKLFAPLDIRAKGVLILWPLGATLVVFLSMLLEDFQRLLSRSREPAAPPPPQELAPFREEGNHTSSYPYADPTSQQDRPPSP